MKIIILTIAFPPKWLGGVEIASCNLARVLAKNGHEVHVLTSHDAGIAVESRENGFCVHRIKFPRIWIGWFFIFAFEAMILCKRIKPDLIHAQTIQMGFCALIAKKLFKIPFLVYGHGFDVYFDWNFKGFISKSAIKNADAAVALTNEMKLEMQKMHPREISIIPNGVDLDKFRDLSKEDARKGLGYAADEKIIIYVGRLHPVKGLDYLIEAFKMVEKKIKRAKLVIIGQGNQKGYLASLAKSFNLEDNIIFRGEIANNEVPRHLVASDVFVLPSLSESFGIANIEAMAAGLPVVATKVRGMAEIIKDGENGFLVEPKEPEQISEKIILLLENAALSDNISRNNRNKAKDYSWEMVVRLLEEEYSTIVK
jgi:N-acetyl-alpha-D-glucosaminyl L-malate synthase BshA